MLPVLDQRWHRRPARAYQEAVKADAPLAYWRLNDTPTSGNSFRATDLSGNGNHGTYSNDGSTVAGVTTGQATPVYDGSGVAFDGAAGLVTLPGSLSIAAGAPITIEWWQYCAAADVKASSAFTIGNVTLPTNRCQCHNPFSDSVLYWDYGDISSGVGRLSVSYAGFFDAWVHIACTSDGAGRMDIYFNGVSVAGKNAASAPTAIQAGGFLGQYGGSNAMKGRMTEFAIYTHVLSPARILYHYNRGAGR